MRMDERWFRPDDQLPKDGEIVDVMLSNGRTTQLKRSGRLWFVPDGSMYVYYEPTFWKPAADREARRGERTDGE